MLIYGSSNTNGSGSAANLTPENGTEVVWEYDPESSGAFHQEEYIYDFHENIYEVGGLIDTVSEGQQTLAIGNYGEWNDDGVKEVYIDSDQPGAENIDYMYVYNFVDVDIDIGDWATNPHSEFVADHLFYSPIDLHVQFEFAVYGAKRGHIDASQSIEDVGVLIQPQSNGSSWSNLFEVETGSGNDAVRFESFENDGMDLYVQPSSEWTEFDVSMAEGDDTFIYSIHQANNDAMTRFVDGGEGFDSLLLHRDSDDIEFSGFELITVDGDGEEVVTLTMDQELLEDNSSSEQGLILDSVEVELTDDYTSIEVADLSQAQSDYLSEHDLDSSEFAAVTVTYGDESYTLLTNEVSDAWS